MASFTSKIEGSFPDGIKLPDECRMLFDWMETSGFIRGRNADQAMLYPIGSVDDEDGLMMFFAPAESKDTERWLGNNDKAVTDRLTAFFCTGGDGSYAGLWLDNHGKQHFVHLGSGSGSTLCCLITDQPINFLRLISIGYEELCWPEYFDRVPEDVEDRDGLPPPVQLQNWIKTTFGVTIPKTASEIVSPIAEMTDKHSDDPFWQWTQHVRR